MPEKQSDPPAKQKVGITIYVEGGMVHEVYTTIPEDCDVEVELLDFDNARADEDDPDALDKAWERLKAAEKEQRQIF